MELMKVQSSNIDSIGYEPTLQILIIKFLSGGTYEYNQVPFDIFNKLQTAESKGKFFHQFIRSSFPYKKITLVE